MLNKTVDCFLKKNLNPQDQYEDKTYRVITEFEGGEVVYGFEGLCVKAKKTEGQAELTLVGSDEGGRVSRDAVPAEYCAEVNPLAKKPSPLLDFKRQRYERKLMILGRWHH